MQHQAAVCEGHSLAHLGEQPHPPREVELVLVAVAIDWHAVHVLHHQIGLAQRGDAAVEETGDGRMFERREDLPLRLELLDQRRIRQPQIHDLDGDALLERLVGAVRGVDGGHAPAGNERVHQVAAQLYADMGIG